MREETITFATTRFGLLEAAVSALVTFPDGLLGFESARRFLAVPHGDGETPFVWLQSVDTPDLAFLLMPPAAVPNVPGYTALLPREIDIACWVIVTVPPGRPRDMTANLAGPLQINMTSRIGRQLVLATEDERMTAVRHRLFPKVAVASSQPAQANLR